jgi:hypothetical protein
MPEIPITLEHFHQSRWGKLKESVVKKIDKKGAKKDIKTPTVVVVSEKKKTEVKKITPIKKAPIKSSGRPIEQVLVGSWNALKQIPEKQGRGVLNIYDKLRFPKPTTEEQKVNDKVHVFLKKYQKEIGWGVTGVEAAAVTYGVVKGFQYLKERRAIRNASRPDRSVDRTPRVVPVAMEATLSIPHQKLKDALLEKMRVENVLRPRLLPEHEQKWLEKCPFSDDLREKIHAGVLEEFAGVLDARKGTLEKILWDGERRDAIDNMMILAAGRFEAAQLRLGGIPELNLAQLKKDDHIFVDVKQYISIWRHMMEKSGLYDRRGVNGHNIEDLLRVIL